MPKQPTCLCGECQKCYQREWRRRWYAVNPDRGRKATRRYRERHPEVQRSYDRARGSDRGSDSLKISARSAISNGIRLGTVQRQPCELCGDQSTEAHHEDYSRPLDVRWLCRTHHMELHRTVSVMTSQAVPA